MFAEIKEQWLTDLLSDEFEQGHNWLNKDGKLCCLGVLCERGHAAGVCTRTVSENGMVRYDGDASVLPRSVALWAGLVEEDGDPDRDPSIETEDGTFTLSALNDNGTVTDPDEPDHPWTFAQIAAVIREQIPAEPRPE